MRGRPGSGEGCHAPYRNAASNDGAWTGPRGQDRSLVAGRHVRYRSAGVRIVNSGRAFAPTSGPAVPCDRKARNARQKGSCSAHRPATPQREWKGVGAMPHRPSSSPPEKIALLRLQMIRLENDGRSERRAFRSREDLSVLAVLWAWSVLAARNALRGLSLRRLGRELAASGDPLRPPALPDPQSASGDPGPSASVSYRLNRCR
jgi:hypothetical protein